MTWRLVQKGTKGIAIGWLIGPGADTSLREALPGWAIVCSTERALAVTFGDLQAARALAQLPPDVPCGIFGWSAGCQSVRAALMSHVVPSLAFVACFDGTAADFPTPRDWQIGVWKSVAEQARKGEIVAIFTCSSMTYTERLPTGAYMATGHVLEKVLGKALEPGKPLIEGELYAERFESGDVDAKAHERQVQEVMPKLLAERVGSRGGELAAMLRAAIVAPVKDIFAHATALVSMSSETRGARALTRALEEVGVHETEGPLTTPRVAEYLAGCTRGGKNLGLVKDETAWCAAFASWSAKTRAGALDAPHGYRASVAELVTDAKGASVWHEEKDFVPEPGDLAIWGRNGEDPRKGGHGHVSRVVVAKPLQTVGGNEGVYGEVKTTNHTDAPLGWISYAETKSKTA